MIMPRHTILTLLIASVAMPTAARAEDACAAPLFAIDDRGRTTHGSKQALLAAASRGEPMRVGWRVVFGAKPQEFVQHWADALFVTIFENEVFTQVPAVHRQIPQPGKGHIALSPASEQWSASLGSNGRLVARFSNGSAPQEQRVAQTWCLTPAAAAACRVPQWRLVYRHDTDGRAKTGSKPALLAAIRRGDPVRLAWGSAAPGAPRSVEHSADPVFVSIASNSEVYAQLAEHIAQQSYWERGKADFDQPSVMWRGVMGTDGSFDAVLVDRASGKTVRRMPQRAGIAWFAFSPEPACDARPPLELAAPGGVKARS